MFDVPGDCVLTYDPEYVDLHSESTDFEESRIPRVTPKNGNHSLLNSRKVYKHDNRDRPWNIPICTSQMSNNCSSKELWESETIYSQMGKELEVRKSYHNKKSKVLDSGDQIETIKSKRSLIRHKVIPCISGIFKKSSNNVKQMAIIKENQADIANKDNGCQTCRDHEHRSRKFNNRKQQCYAAAVQPIFAVEVNPPTKVRRPSTRKTPKSDYIKTLYSLTSSSEADRIEDEKRKDRAKWKKQYEDIGRDYLERHTRNKEQQLGCGLLKRRRKPIQVYTSPYQYQWNNIPVTPPLGSTDMCSTSSAVPSVCSGFWEYLCNKINNKQMGDHKPCNCCINSMQNKPHTCCPNIGNGLPPQGGMPRTCPCNNIASSAQSPANLSETHKYMNKQLPTMPPRSQKAPKSPKSPKSPVSPPLKVKYPTKRVECKCSPFTAFQMPNAVPPPTRTQAPTAASRPQPQTQPPPLAQNQPTRPCQLPHDNLTSSVAKKYNGEILCIHNPPCILINGCLNLPPAKQESPPPPATTMWPVLQSKTSYQRVFRKKRPKKVAEIDYEYHTPKDSFQNEAPSIELQQSEIMEETQYQDQVESPYRRPELKKEKIVQSFCHHQPPCEVKWTCRRPKYDSTMPTSCVHVPVCDNLPICMLEMCNKDQTMKPCRHKPRCAEVPICTKKYIVLTAKEEAGTQVRPKNKAKMVCRHEPPCIMIPKCLARQCADGYIPCDAIPDCVHQPLCELIPACCRKSPKEMVSVCSQHPNSCRIV